jgi:phasin family protein
MQQNWSAMLSGMAEANHKAAVAATEFNRIAARTQGLLARRQFAAFEDCLDAGTRHLKVAVESRDPQEAIKRHTEVAVELGEKLVEATQASLEIQVQARDELVRWVEDGMKTVKAGAESAMKPAATTAPARKTTRSTARKTS